MLSLSKFLLCSSLLPSASILVSAAGCTGVGGIIATVLAGDSIAVSYCQTKYPRAPTTVTAPTSTSTVTVTTSTTVEGGTST